MSGPTNPKAQAFFDAAEKQARRQAANEPADDEGETPLARSLDHVYGDELPDGPIEFNDELIEGVVGRNTMTVLYGDSNSGKTYLAVDMAASVVLGTDWLGRRTEGGAVLYLATEAAGSVKLRFQTYSRHRGVKLSLLVVVQSPISLFDGNADVVAVLTLVAQVEARLGAKVALVIGDTLARISAGANENSGEDMGVVMKNADAIRAGIGAAFLWIHHVGKDAAKGMRGWSGMRAFIDTEIEVTGDDATGLRAAEITKQRDLPGKGDRYGFKLLPLVMGRNQWGTERSFCVIESAGAPPKAAKGKRMGEVEGSVIEFLIAHRVGIKKSEVAKHFDGRHPRTSVYRAIDALEKAGAVHSASGMVAAAGAAK